MIVGPGARLPVEGVMHEVRPGSGRQVRQSDGVLLVPGPEDRMAARLKGWLRTRARDRLAEASDRYSARLGRGYSRLTLRDTRSRWGSCTHDGGLMYSWRLILGHPEVLDYVAAHEVAHLRHMDHSAAFWQQGRGAIWRLAQSPQMVEGTRCRIAPIPVRLDLRIHKSRRVRRGRASCAWRPAMRGCKCADRRGNALAPAQR